MHLPGLGHLHISSLFDFVSKLLCYATPTLESSSLCSGRYTRFFLVHIDITYKKSHKQWLFLYLCTCQDSKLTVSVQVVASFPSSNVLATFSSPDVKPPRLFSSCTKKPAFTGFSYLCTCQDSNLEQLIRSQAWYPFHYRCKYRICKLGLQVHLSEQWFAVSDIIRYFH